jgi:flagellar assembly protein FliH
LSKIIKASQIIGKYKIKNHKKSFSLESTAEQKDGQDDNSKNKKNSEQKNKQKKTLIKQQRKKADAEAEQIITEAEIKAAEIIESAQREKEEIELQKEEIFSKIKKEAEAEAIKTAQNKIDKAVNELLLTANSFKAEMKKKTVEAQKNIINFSVKIASIIIDVKLEQEPEIINNIVSEMLSKIDESHNNITVRIHPDLIPYLEQNNLYSRLEEKNLNFKGDFELEKGDCIVESSLGGKEGSISHKIELIREELLKEVEDSV